MTINAPNATSARADLTRTIGGAPAWVPTDVVGLRFWINPANTASITASAGNVSQINDASGSSGGPFNFVQSIGANQPGSGTRTVNSKNVLDFVGANVDVLSSEAGDPPSTIMGSATSAHVFYVLVSDAAFQGAALRGWGTHASENVEPYSDGGIYHGWGSTTRQTCGAPAGFVGAVHQVDIRTAAGAWAYNLDGATQYSTATNTVAWHAGTFATFAGANWDGALCEVFAYNSVLTGTNLTNARTYLKTRWGTP